MTNSNKLSRAEKSFAKKIKKKFPHLKQLSNKEIVKRGQQLLNDILKEQPDKKEEND